LVVRMLSLGLVLALSALAFLGLSPLSLAEGAQPGWSAYSTPVKRPVFRPADRAWSRSSAVRPRSQMNPAPRQSAAPRDTRGQSVFSANRAGGRKAVPVTRGQDLGLRFRPDERDSPYGQSGAPSDDSRSGNYQSELQSQFRPIPSRRKPTYEELQAGGVSPQPSVAPVMPYPALPPPLPGYGGGLYGPGW